MSLRAFCILFTNSLATPSLRNSSVMVTSKATVNAPSFATNQPSISLEEISTSEISKVIFFPLTAIEMFLSFSILLISSWLNF